MKAERAWQLFIQFFNIKFCENPSNGLVVPCVQMDGDFVEIMNL
jgi:hypothetical protein